MDINLWELFKNTFSFLFKFWQIWVFLVSIVVIKVMVEILLPREFQALKAAIRFKKGEQWRSDRDLLQ